MFFIFIVVKAHTVTGEPYSLSNVRQPVNSFSFAQPRSSETTATRAVLIAVCIMLIDSSLADSSTYSGLEHCCIHCTVVVSVSMSDLVSNGCTCVFFAFRYCHGTHLLLCD